MKIYTKNGDQGKTSLVDGSPISKAHIRLEVYGTLDELNSHVGLLVGMLDAESIFSAETTSLKEIQIWLFQLGSQLACSDPEMAKKLPTINHEPLKKMEQEMDLWDSELPPLRNFILPGGHPASAQAHICRTIARRAERACVTLEEQTPLDLPATPFLNRLSDHFYMLARRINHRLKIDNIEWKP